MSIDIKPEYVLDDKGRKTAALLDIRSYRKLIAYLEDLEDSQQILSLKQRALKLRPYEQFRQELQEQGLL